MYTNAIFKGRPVAVVLLRYQEEAVRYINFQNFHSFQSQIGHQDMKTSCHSGASVGGS